MSPFQAGHLWGEIGVESLALPGELPALLCCSVTIRSHFLYPAQCFGWGHPNFRSSCGNCTPWILYSSLTFLPFAPCFHKYSKGLEIPTVSGTKKDLGKSGQHFVTEPVTVQGGCFLCHAITPAHVGLLHSLSALGSPLTHLGTSVKGTCIFS